MWFRNLQAYRITGGNITLNNVEEALSRHPLQACLQMDMHSRGWVVPREEHDNFVHAYGQQWLIACAVEKKLLPTAVINQHAKDRLVNIEQVQGYKPGKKQIRDIKEATIIELLPRAFTQRQTTYAWIDAVKNRLIIDTASIHKADEFVELLIKSISGLTLAPLETHISPSSAMTRWLSGNDVPAHFTIDRDCELQGTDDERATVKYTHHVLEAEETARHIRAGKKVIKLAMTWNSKVSFVLHDSLQLRRVAPQDILKEPTESTEEMFASDFAIMTGELSQLIAEVIDALGGEDRD